LVTEYPSCNKSGTGVFGGDAIKVNALIIIIIIIIFVYYSCSHNATTQPTSVEHKAKQT